MPYPTPLEFTTFLDDNPTRYKQTPLPDGYNSTQDILNEVADRKLIPNPVPQEDVPAPLDIPTMQAVISEESLGRLSDTWWNVILAYVSGTITVDETVGTREDAKGMVDNALSRGNIENQEAIDLKDLIDSTIPDPTYESEIQDDSDAKKEWDLGGMSSSFVNSSLGRV